MKRMKVLKAAIVVGIIVGVVAYFYGPFLLAWYSPPPLAFSGNSSDLKQTIIVPALDTRIPPGKNAIWCGSFQLAWNAIKDTIVKEPIRLSNAQPIADKLNASPFGSGDLDAGSYYAAAGPLTDEFVQSVKRETRKRFPRLSPSLDGLHGASDGLLAFAALEVASRFTMPYLQNPDPIEFTDSAGNSTKLSSFGVLSKFDGRSSIELRKQPEVLYSHAPADDPGVVGLHPGELDEFILDLCKDTDTQIIVAMVPRQDSLAATLEHIWARAEEYRKLEDYQHRSKMDGLDTLMVPDMNWHISHRFKELEGSDKRIENATGKGYWLQEAFQGIAFTLDRSGARVGSTSWQVYAALPRRFAVTRPFLVVMKQRTSTNPFFVMWVDNAELLTPM